MFFGIDTAAYPVSGFENDDVVCRGGGVSEDCSGGLEARNTRADDSNCLLGGDGVHFPGWWATRSCPGFFL